MDCTLLTAVKYNLQPSMQVMHIPVRDLDIEVTCRYAIPANWMRPGIYQLWVGDQSYIGKGMNVRRRLMGSHKFGDSFDRCRVLSLFDEGISAKELNNAEAYWIKLLRPQLNLGPVKFQ